jgi:hypothetical protein
MVILKFSSLGPASRVPEVFCFRCPRLRGAKREHAHAMDHTLNAMKG